MKLDPISRVITNRYRSHYGDPGEKAAASLPLLARDGLRRANRLYITTTFVEIARQPQEDARNGICSQVSSCSEVYRREIVACLGEFYNFRTGG